MALAGPYTYKPYAPPATNGLARLLGSFGPDGGAHTPAVTPPAAAPSVSSTFNQGRNGAPQLPAGEFGENSSAPLHVGQAPPGGFPSAPATSSSSSGGGGGGGGYDFSGDPILAQIRALNQRLVADAEGSALAGRKQNEITFGFDPSMHYEDQATEMAARQNAFSTLAQLLAGHNQRAQSTDEGANKANLFYSSARAGAVRGEGKQYTLQQSLGNQDFQGKMRGIAQALLDVKNQAQEREIQAEQAAYERALAYGGGGSGGGGGGGVDLNDFIRGNNRTGLSDADVLAAAQRAAPAGQTPHDVAHEGEVTIQNGRPGVTVKYDDSNGGTNTIWVPL